MIGADIFGTSVIAGGTSPFGESVSTFLLYLTITSGILVGISFFVTRIIKKFIQY